MKLILDLPPEHAGIYVKSPVFEGFPEDENLGNDERSKDLPEDGKFYLYDGCTGERFDNRVVVGYIYMLETEPLGC